MRDQIIVRPNQQLLEADLNNIQGFVQTSMDHVVRDGLGASKRYVGFTSAKAGVAEVSVEPGLLYLGGPVHRADSVKEFDVIGQLPVATKRMAVIVGWGSTSEEDIERRNFRTDVTTNLVEPQDVAMRRSRIANIDIVYGQESASPQLPPIADGLVHIATITLATTGVELVEMNDAAALRSSEDIYALALSNEAWRLIAEPLMSTIRTDLAALAESLRGSSSSRLVEQLTYDVAVLKETAGIDEDAVSYGADRFLTDDEADLLHAQSDCRIEEGLRFNWDGVQEIALSMFNPLDPAATVDAGTGMMLPKYGEVARNIITGFAGDISISQYASQEVTLTQHSTTRTRIRYGQSMKVCTNSNWWNSGIYDPATGIFRLDGEVWQVDEGDLAEAVVNHRMIRVTQFWVDTWQTPYWELITTEQVINGAVIAQTVLNAQGGWYLGSEFEFTTVAADGAVTMAICETIQGAPDMSRVIASVTKQAADLKTRPAKTRFGVPPIYMERGKRYARVLITQGGHRVAIADKNSYQEGTLFSSTDGAWFTGDLDKDLVSVDYFANFANARSVVEFSSISLAGGITDLDMLYDSIVPDGTEIGWEIQPEGQAVWSRLEGGALQSLLYNKPAQVKLRAVFNGTSDVQPMLRLTKSRLRATRSKDTFVGVSSAIVLPAASSNITVTSYLEHFDDGDHTAVISLFDDGDVERAASVVEDLPANKGIRRKATFALGGATASFRIKHAATAASDLDLFHINETVWHGY